MEQQKRWTQKSAVKAAKRKIVGALAAIVDGCIDQAKGGSVPHAKFLLEWAALTAPAAKPEKAKETKPKEKEEEPDRAVELLELLLDKLDELEVEAEQESTTAEG